MRCMDRYIMSIGASVAGLFTVKNSQLAILAG